MENKGKRKNVDELADEALDAVAGGLPDIVTTAENGVITCTCGTVINVKGVSDVRCPQCKQRWHRFLGQAGWGVF